MKTIAIALTFLFATTAIGASKNVETINSENYAFAKAHTEPDNNVIKVAILLDTSNSMDGLIDQAKAQLWELVNELSYAKCGNDVQPTLQIALYEYGNDRLNAREGYIRQVSAFTNDLDDISGKLFGLTTNGGNEYCGKVIQTSLNQLDWGKRVNDLNLIFIAGNEPFNQGPVSYENAAGNACAKDVTVNTIFCGDYMQAEQDSNATQYGRANAVKRAVSKSSHFYKNSSWDLVDAVSEDDLELEEVAVESLPQELQGKTTKEIEAYVEAKRKERAKIQEEIAELNKKRIEYVSKKQNASDNELRNAMLDAIKKQATKKEYTWEQ